MISRAGLNFNEYLNLLKLRHDEKDKSFPYEIDPRYFKRLLEDKFIVQKVELNADGGEVYYVLGPEGLKLFEGDDLFEEFFALYPSYVETGLGRRAISAKDPNSISGKATHDIWKRVTKNKPHLQRKIINCLKNELEHRKTNNSMAYLQGIDTWLRQATWEKWDTVSDEKNNNTSIKL